MAQDRNQTSHRVGHDAPASGTAIGADTTARMSGTEQVVRPTGAHTGHSTEVRPAKTSAAAVFALVFGLAALFCALTGILSSAAVLFGVTGKGVAIGGLVTAVLGLLLGGAVIGGLSALVNDEQRLDQLQNRIDDLRTELPSTGQLREELPAS